MFPVVNVPSTPQTPKEMLLAERRQHTTPCTPVQTVKYFGDHARDNFFERSKWLNQQLKITELNSQQPAVKALYFGDELDKCAMEEEADELMNRDMFENRTYMTASMSDEGKDANGIADLSIESSQKEAKNGIAATVLSVEAPSSIGRSAVAKSDRTNSAILERRSGTSMAITPKRMNGSKSEGLFPLHPDELPSINRCAPSPGAAKVSELLARRRSSATGHGHGSGSRPGTHSALGTYSRSPVRSPAPGRGLNGDDSDGHGELPEATKPPHKISVADRSFSALADVLEAEAMDGRSPDSLRPPPTAGSTSGAAKYNDPLLAQPSEDVLESLAIPTSPRTAYLVNCNKSNVLPRPSLVLRKEFSKDLNLAHKGMGDQMATLVAESIDDLPYIESLNISDNNLGCPGLCAFFNAIRKIKGFKHLDVSDNALGPESSSALANYLAPSDCPLVQLGLRNADIDDFECARFIAAVANNMFIRDLDMSHNKLGTAETLNVVNPDVVTASEALAEMLADNNNRLEKLNVSWNMIRLDGGMQLVSALSTNEHLTYLDLSYNALGQEGGVALGRAIMTNHTLKYLNISSNGIGESACITITQGVMCNQGLEQLILDGNPIGEQGQMALMQLTLVPRTTRLVLSAHDCNQFIKDDRCICKRGTSAGHTPPLTRFDCANPLGVFELDLSHDFDRAIAGYVLDVVARHASFIIQNATYEEKGKKPEPLELKSIWNHVGESCYSENEHAEIEYARRRISILKEEARCIELFENYCRKFEGPTRELLILEREYFYYFLQQELGFTHILLAEVDEIIEAYDVDGSWTISVVEFKHFIVQYCSYLEVRVTSLVRVPILSLAHEDKKYIPPTSGILRFEALDGVFKKQVYTVLSSLQLHNLCDLAKISQNITHYLSNTVRLIKVRLPAALHLYRTMYAENAAARFKIIPVVLRSVDDYWEARRFLSIVTSDNREDMQCVRDTMGFPLKTLLHFFDGYYSLNLKDEGDRNCLARLLDVSEKVNNERKERCVLGEGLVGDLSQHGNWTCFRNETMDGRPIEITASNFLSCPVKGVLQFDFFTGLHPKRTDTPITDIQFLTVLKSVFLIDENGMVDMFNKLKKLKCIGDHSNRGDGTSVEHTVSKERRERIFHVMEDFYSNLKLRPDREAMKYEGKDEVVEKAGSDGSKRAKPPGPSGAKTKEKEKEAAKKEAAEKAEKEDKDAAEESAINTAGPTRPNSGNQPRSNGDQAKPKSELSYIFSPADLVATPIVRTASMLNVNPTSPTKLMKRPESIAKFGAALEDRDEKDREATRLHKRRKGKIDIHRHELKNILLDEKHGPHFKALRVADVLADKFMKGYVTCRQLALMVSCFPQGKLWIYDHCAAKKKDKDGKRAATPATATGQRPGTHHAGKKPFHFFGTFRVELIIALMPHTIDMFNFDLVMREFSPEEAACMTCRVGYFNGIFNPMKPEGHHYFNMRRHVEERQCLKCFLVLSKIEPGLNWSEEAFRFKMGESEVGGFKVGMDWMSEEGLYKSGLVQFTFCSAKLEFIPTGRANLSGIEDHSNGYFLHTPAVENDEFKANPSVRRALCYFTCLDPALMLTEEERSENPKETIPPPKDALEFFRSPMFLETEPEPFKTYLTVHPKSTYESEAGVAHEDVPSFAAPIQSSPAKGKK